MIVTLKLKKYIHGYLDFLMALFIQESMTILLNFLQCPPRWTILRVIITPGKEPLPAEALIWYSTHGDHEKFYALAGPCMWDMVPMDHKIYKDLVQTTIRVILARSLIMFFKKVEYRQDPVTKLYRAQFPKHHEHMLLDCIDIMKNECDHYINWTTKKYGSDVQLLEKAISTTMLGKLVNLIMDCTDTVRAKKNWNSHCPALGSMICQLSSIISGLRKASEEEPNPEMNELIPRGVVYTGHKYGNTHSVCTECMMSTHESWIIYGGNVIYLNAERCNQENHTDIVNKMFSETVEGYPSIPAPRPTRTYTYDFCCTFMGACLVDGECKDTATDADKGFLVLHCLDQLVTQDMALCMLTTSASWKSLRSGLRRFLYAVSNATDILVEHFSSLNLEKVGHMRAEAWEKGWWEPDFMFTDQRGLQTKRTIINPERFLYSRANMNPNAIKLLNRDDIQPELSTTLEGRVAYHQECQERNKRQKKTYRTVER